MIEKIPSSVHKIRFKDCDPLGHLFNTRYIEYMLEAREDHIMDHYQMDLHDYVQTRGMAWVIVEHQIKYLKEAVRNEWVLIKSLLIHYDEKILMNEYQMWNKEHTQLKALLWTKFLHIHVPSKKTIEHPEDIKEKMEEMLVNIEQMDMKFRINQLMSAAH